MRFRPYEDFRLYEFAMHHVSHLNGGHNYYGAKNHFEFLVYHLHHLILL